MKAHAPRGNHERLTIGALAILLFLSVWEGLSRGWWANLLTPLLGEAARAFTVKAIFISSPSAIAHTAWEMFFKTGEIWAHLGISGLELVVGLSAAIVVGVPLGLISGRYRTASYVLEPFVTALNATPQVAFLPLIVLWIGAGFPMRALIIFLLAVIPIVINTQAGVRTVDPRLLKLARSFSSSELHTFNTIILPSSVPFLIAGLRLAVGRSMIGIVVGELYGSAVGVGIMINKAGSMFETDKVFVGVLVIVLVGLVLSELLRWFERRFEVWRAAIGDDL